MHDGTTGAPKRVLKCPFPQAVPRRLKMEAKRAKNAQVGGQSQEGQ